MSVNIPSADVQYIQLCFLFQLMFVHMYLQYSYFNPEAMILSKNLKIIDLCVLRLIRDGIFIVYFINIFIHIIITILYAHCTYTYMQIGQIYVSYIQIKRINKHFFLDFLMYTYIQTYIFCIIHSFSFDDLFKFDPHAIDWNSF